mgnify:CR=1 FL=1
MSHPIKQLCKPKHICDPSSFDKLPLRVRFDLMDFDHHLWGWDKLSSEQYIHFLKFIHALEKQTWAEIKLAAGGRGHGTNHHPLEITKFNKIAQKRLHELNLDTIIGDTLFSLRLNSLTRIYGVRNEEYFRPIWHDPHHDQPENAAYPVG